MDTTIRELLTELEDWGRLNDAENEDRSKKMLNLEPETAQFISILIRSSKSKNILEIGTSNGYSTIWLAWASQANDGRVTSIEHSPEKQVMADENLRRAGLRDWVELKLGDATEIVAVNGGFLKKPRFFSEAFFIDRGFIFVSFMALCPCPDTHLSHICHMAHPPDLLLFYMNHYEPLTLKLISFIITFVLT